jgi:hypothetical protein
MVHTVSLVLDGWIYWDFSGMQCEFLKLSFQEHCMYLETF